MTETSYQVTIPQETVNDESVRIVGWKAASGTRVEKDQLICEIETSKAVIEMHAPVAGLIEYFAAVGDEVAVGTALCTIDEQSSAPAKPMTQVTSSTAKRPVPTGFPSTDYSAVAAAPKQPTPAALPVSQDSEPATVPALPPRDLPPSRMTPLARKVAAEYKIDITAFPLGSLIRRNDVLRQAGLPLEDAIPPVSARIPPPERAVQTPVPKPIPAVGVPVVWKNLVRKKVVEGKILGAGQSNTVQSSVTRRVKAPLLRARVRELHHSEAAFVALIVFEASRVLLQFPQLNALHDSGRIGEYSQVNINWALDSGGNLVAPVVKQCDQKSLGEVFAVMERQLENYLDKGLALDELTGGTFTVSDLSGDGICFFNPLISQGQAAILGVSSDLGPNGEEDLYLTLAFDHQLAEGRSAARFLEQLGTRLEAHSFVESLKAPLFSPVSDTTLMASGVDRATIGNDEAHCEICQRSYPQLQRSRAVLLRSEFPAGLVCSLCVGGF